MLHCTADATCGQEPQPVVRALLQERFEGIDEELELHIEDCQWQYLTAYERFQMHGNPHDRDEALLHLHRMNEAILARSPAVKAARHAQFEQDLQEQVAYFASEAAARLGRAV